MATVEKYELIRKDEDGNLLKPEIRYRVRYRTPDHRQTDKRGFVRKRDAEAFATEVEGRKLRNEYVAPAMGRATIGQLGGEWLARQKGHLKRNSYRSIESSWRVHVEPRWSRTPVGNIVFTDVQGWIAELGQVRGAKVVRFANAVLSSILEDAVRDRRIASNPARGVKLPAITKKPNTYLTADQLHALADEAGRYRSLVLLLGTAGLRWGEAVGLRVSDVNFLTRKVLIQANATGGKLEATPKGGESRTIVAAQFVIDELAVTVTGKRPGDLIWPSQTGGYLKPPSPHDSWLSGAVKRCQDAAEKARAEEAKSRPDRRPVTPVFPRVTAHDLRHTGLAPM